uniref:Uncharacterized protein n=1 Tax=Meloidogyne enterolobii TaxID=390850 RepID=A0A6V7TN60_MELEN|nr:unnamed protein product [Meloidogyne enterolobii]
MLVDTEFEKKIKPKFNKFILTEPINGQLGNQMYRFASLYAIGKLLNRTPVYIQQDNYIKNIEVELSKIFPNFFKQIYFLKSEFKIQKKFQLATTCCDYNNPKILLKENNAKILRLIGGIYFESYKYFDHLREEILNLFEFGPEIVKEIEEATQRIYFLNDNARKICIHTRFGDFVGFGESVIEQVEALIELIPKLLFRLIKRNVIDKRYSLLIFGEDKNFLNQIKINKNKFLFNKIYHVLDLSLSRGGELYFAREYCDALFLTAPLSSFAFWMGYLMPNNLPIFYIRKQLLLHPSKTTIYPFDTMQILPKDWFAIEENWLENKKKIKEKNKSSG